MAQISENFKISLIIPAYNEEKYLADCLTSVIENSQGQFCEIIVVNNNSTDNTQKVAESFPGVKVIMALEKGPNAARQCGYLASVGDILAFIDADTRMPENWLTKIISAYKKEENLVCLSGPYRYYDGTPYRNFIMGMAWWLSAPLTYRLVGYMVLGGNFAAKRVALDAMGGFNKEIKFYGDDTDIARRLHKFGRVVFKMNFYIYTSSRRFVAEGLFKTNFVYALNFIWEVLFHRPFTMTSKDIRSNTNNKNE